MIYIPHYHATVCRLLNMENQTFNFRHVSPSWWEENLSNTIRKNKNCEQKIRLIVVLQMFFIFQLVKTYHMQLSMLYLAYAIEASSLANSSITINASNLRSSTSLLEEKWINWRINVTSGEGMTFNVLFKYLAGITYFPVQISGWNHLLSSPNIWLESPTFQSINMDFLNPYNSIYCIVHIIFWSNSGMVTERKLMINILQKL